MDSNAPYSIPTIGLQTDVGSIDVAVKVLQSAIIVGSLFVLGLPKSFTLVLVVFASEFLVAMEAR